MAAAAGLRLGGKALFGSLGLAAGLAAPGVALADKKVEKDAYGRPLFDPEALERGAAALREINKSPYAKQVSVCVCVE